MFFLNLYNSDNDLIQIEKAITEKQSIDKRKTYEQYIKMYHVTRDFIIKKGLLLYGGLALNIALPKTKRFYDAYELPDYDFFSHDARKHAKELADLYHKLGYNYVEVKPGMHDSTYKVFVEFQPVADITDIPRYLFDRLSTMSDQERNDVLKNNPSLDMRLVPLSILRMSFHIELSRPDGYIERWPKIYKRMVAFYSQYPLVYSPINECNDVFVLDGSERVHELVEFAKNYIDMHELPLGGLQALKVYLKYHNTPLQKNMILEESMPLLETVSIDYESTTQGIVGILRGMTESNETIVSKYHSALNKSEMIPQHYIIYLKTANSLRPLVIVYKANACYAYKTVDASNVLTIDTMLSFYYALLFTKRAYFNIEKIKCIINILLNLQSTHINSNKHVWKRFELKCYGYQPTTVDSKKKNWISKKQVMIYRPNSIHLAQKKSQK